MDADPTTRTIAVDAPTTEPATSSSDYVPQVGDVVEVIAKGTVSCGHPIGSTGEILEINADNGHLDVLVGNMSLWHSPCSLRLVKSATPTFTGTYEECQKQWIKHHGLKAGSKVKVVRKFKYKENGFCCGDWNGNRDKAGMQQGIYEISYIDETSISIGGDNTNGKWNFPYFALEPVQ